ncbi:Acetyltransferase (GNAT) family protein [Pedobacter westerhofensis]|uniref:Acetyltransferase (GNAT) family protein n=1 Tax=Pedobacter westerhofensis TaxID=425512 RepID=A0A521BPY2_9SPHI|nr:GNAT family N-acetyltransferase [Pedobacter westerhofensis]SMO49125.1 Acetyltransferase (GNAT) family protein [Pedobacter westerhofensis]
MKNTLNIKPIFNDHCDQIIDLILSIQQKEFNLTITINQQLDLLDIETNYHQGGGNFWGAFLGDELVGTIALINSGHQSGCIRKMFVKKEYRGKELGTAQLLLNTLLQFCHEKEIMHIYLGTVHQLKAAHRFYERNGFTPITVSELPPYFPLMLTDNMFYQIHQDQSAVQ